MIKRNKNRSSTGSAKIRPPAAAGRFYPSDPAELRNLVETLLAEVPPGEGPAPKAVIAPHAGYAYSGPIAASAYGRLRAARGIANRIVVLGPSHFVAFEGLATTSAEAFVTPLGAVPVDLDAVRTLNALPQVKVFDEAHELEHALEVQLPFLQVVLGDFSVVPLVVGQAGASQIAQVLESLWDGPQTRFVISSDLSHYLDSESARALDAETARAIESLKPSDIGESQACGRLPIQGLLEAAVARGLRGRTMDLRNSGDTAGPRHRVVGYGAFAFEEMAPEG